MEIEQIINRKVQVRFRIKKTNCQRRREEAVRRRNIHLMTVWRIQWTVGRDAVRQKWSLDDRGGGRVLPGSRTITIPSFCQDEDKGTVSRIAMKMAKGKMVITPVIL